MASIRDLKKDINAILAVIIEAVYVWESLTQQPGSKTGEVITNEAISVFNGLIAKVNDRKVSNRKAHLKKVNQEIEAKARALLKKLDTLD